ncbi:MULTISPECIES: EAL domain-containing protein [unclassified Janthinobacterium]|uniref:EAL domain-containing protein n=1 Tax=unclassified Janthinobacterium TaxID=2610881 RepID=UPI0016099CA0|nr:MULTISPECIES: EAL domain-containing protein [unclassified Janthinobacterium]MBB5368110.1 diguanylate cyclase (GGDEF)-like protein/PAS domain S-box-containing protein [Janthinobacterium sp. K2C7]MBB5379412.1 diguanylate cyclase (GGDEF)-like protein/PAS domain S-box-containing protein [Janthinobacterium sp. K2Li3]MBB5386492.1 diguanylate cyclase (GGDEF)-like protein/PAS domain S-box-containing protein [Janthinobacterium sp. K2E3]
MISQADLYGAKILVVDDQEVNLRLLEHLLESGGYTSVTSTLDPRAVAGLHQHHQYDLIILDLVMPGMSGYEVMDALRPFEREGYLPVLVIAADPDAKLAALEAGARDFLSKPFDAVEVLTRIRNMLEVRLLHRSARHYNGLLERTVAQRTAQLQRFRGAMDATSDAIFLIDVMGMALVDVNDGACRLLGHTRAELLSLSPGELLPRPPPAPLDGLLHLAPELIECELLRRDLSMVPVELGWHWHAQAPVEAGFDGPRSLLLIAVARDISERRQTQERLKQLAHYDSLTGLPNRGLFYQTLRQALELAQEKAWRIVVLFIALDRFKSINDTLGAALGDELLRQFSNRLVGCVRLRDTVGRLGNDEFALILTMSRNQQEAVMVANQVREALRAPFDLHGHPATLTASIGIAIYPDDATDPETLIKYANTAMGGAKQAGRDGYRFFTAGMNVQVLARLDLELALRHALEHQQFILYYQPKVDLRTGRISGVEALLRWRRPGYGLVAPAEFVPVLEDTGLIVRVGAWVIQAACRQIAQWRDSEVGPVHVAVNVSSRQFAEGDLEGEVTRALALHQVPAELLELELTETALMSNAERTIVVLGKLKKIGVKVTIDDFGTGYSSLAYLQRFPIDKLKIDIAFVRNITNNPNDAAIALAIISMAHSLKLSVVAEGVESRPQLEYLRRNRCDEIQGFYFSRALPALELGQMIAAGAGLALGHDPAAQAAQTLLIVDDDVNVLSSLHRLFRPDGYQILTASTPSEGFEMLALHRVHVIVCDQRMPSMSGTEFLSKVKELYPETIRIILSGYTGLEAVLDSINRGAIYRFYTKPWDDTELRDNIRLAFQHYWMVNPPGLARVR